MYSSDTEMKRTIILKIALSDLLANGEKHGALTWPDPFQRAMPFHAAGKQFASLSLQTSAYRRASKFIDWFISSKYMESYTEGSTSDWINDPERAERCDKAAENGCDGSTHAEIIGDWRHAFTDWIRDRRSWNGYPTFESAVEMYLDELESWHEMNGTLWQEVG